MTSKRRLAFIAIVAVNVAFAVAQYAVIKRLADAAESLERTQERLQAMCAESL